MVWVLLIGGLAVLVLGAEVLVRGAVGLAGRLGVAPLLIGLTVVSFGTSSPEVAVSLSALAEGRGDISLGNAVGSNIFNVLFILGLASVVRPLVVHQKLVRLDVPLMIGVSLLLWVLLLDGVLSRLDGVLLLAGIVAYTALAIRSSKRESEAVRDEYRAALGPPARRPSSWRIGALLVAGLALAVLGARWFVAGAVAIASSLGVDDLVVGLTIVAAGTSLPEVATSVVAVVRGQRDIAVGNVVGSNIFNVLAIQGLCGVVATDGLRAPASLLAFDLPVMIAVALVCLPVCFTGRTITRREGALLLAGYAAYILYLVLDAEGHAALDGFTRVMLLFVLPLATLALVASTLSALRRPRPADDTP